MRTLLNLSLLVSIIFLSLSCSKNADEHTMVSILVVNKLGVAQENVEVHMFDQPQDQLSSKMPEDAIQTKITYNDGVVQFYLDDANVIDQEGKAELSFRVLQETSSGDYTITGQVDLEVYENEIISKQIVVH